MIKEQMKTKKGISLISLTITVAVLLILTNVIIYNVKDNLKIGKLKEMQNDITNLRDKVASYYAQNGKIPASIEYTDITAIKEAGVISDTIDTGKFLVIDLSAIENLTLNYGEDFEKVKTDSGNVNNYKDLYIINETSHNIFYVKGITIDDETFYTDYNANDIGEKTVELRYVDNVKIPEGFYYVGGSKDTGLVISDEQGDDLENSKQGNQFVWIPVENINDFHLINGYYNQGNQYSADYFNANIEPYKQGYETEVLEYYNMYNSVKENKGFYIGRYEAGKEEGREVVVKKDREVYNNIKWGNSITEATGGAVELSKKFAETVNTKNEGKSGVVSTLCYDVQWDATMQFLDNNYVSGRCNENSYVRNSKDRGYYNASSPTKTGSNEIYSEKNIYDMAGNVWEWTMGFYNDTRIVRGGSFGSNNDGWTTPASSISQVAVTNGYNHVGFRIALYLAEEEKWSPVYDKKGIYKDKNGDTAYIPQGFYVSEKSGENTIDEGLVVKDSNNNEFVWVPVDDINDFHAIEGYREGNRQSELGKCQEPYNGYPTEEAEYTEMRNSVENHKGFYIGRFEAGIENSQLVIKKGVSPYSRVPWGNSMVDIEGNNNTSGKTGAVKLAKELEKNNNTVTSTLVYGVQWDAALKFIDPSYTGFAKNSSRQGWYADNLRNTTEGNITTNPNIITGVDLIYSENPNKIMNRQKNIYDMAGNVAEWTMEVYETGRAIRGGTYDSDGAVVPTSFRGAWNVPTLISADVGFRIALYL